MSDQYTQNDTHNSTIVYIKHTQTNNSNNNISIITASHPSTTGYFHHTSMLRSYVDHHSVLSHKTHRFICTHMHTHIHLHTYAHTGFTAFWCLVEHFKLKLLSLAFVPRYPLWLVWTHREGAVLKHNAYNEIYSGKS